jgi:tRNA-specific 2-thiouridylase
MDVCFVGASTAAAFVASRGAAVPGELVDVAGTRLGQHDNLAAFTVGQRKGLGLRTTTAGTEPLYVVDKHRDGRVVIGPRSQLAVAEVVLADCTGLCDLPVPGRVLGLQVRHRAQPVAVQVVASDAGARRVMLSALGQLAAVARGQSGVLYEGDEVVAGGVVIRSATRSACAA